MKPFMSTKIGIVLINCIDAQPTIKALWGVTSVTSSKSDTEVKICQNNGELREFARENISDTTTWITIVSPLNTPKASPMVVSV